MVVTYVRDGQTESARPRARAYEYPVIGSIQHVGWSASVVIGGPWSSCGRCTHLHDCLCGPGLSFRRQSLNFGKQDSVLTIHYHSGRTTMSLAKNLAKNLAKTLVFGTN